ncbi:hypothetical protein BDF20DRAFT_51810 [Mycotypha africana]|uniref:uncharacterized protein n=1 Tax=Mycotypha africana TaxID=64632 RepID=UPI002301E055|nr:uncharacterized protein BDF20DRAFT_51810 [Mycotypha africana]KAI8991589.1 hypothetical protein BDF20DRAFT_51810 [Mycotypha africana]
MEVSELCHDSTPTTSTTSATTTDSPMSFNHGGASNDESIKDTSSMPLASFKESGKAALPSLSKQLFSATANTDKNAHNVNNQHHVAVSQTSQSVLKDKHDYRIQYQLQHQHLKPFLNLPLPPALVNSASADNTINNHKSSSTNNSSPPPPPGYYSQQQPFHSYPPQNQTQQQLFTKHVHQRPIAPHPTPSSTVTAVSLPATYSETNSSHESIGSSSISLKRPSPDDSTIDDDDHALKTIVEQCTSVYQKIGKYRVDPLTETERNKIIDDVFSTTERMLKLLNELQSTTATSSTTSELLKHVNNNNNNKFYSGNNETAVNDDYELIRQARNLQKNSRSKYRRRSRTNMLGHRCHSCNTTDTPEWRRGPDGARTLCNACGLHYSKLLRKGSLTVQTHNFMIEPSSSAPPHCSSSPPLPLPAQPQSQQPHPPALSNDQRTSSRAAVEYPIIQVSGSTNTTSEPMAEDGAPCATAASIPNTSRPMHFMPSNTRIVELKDVEED